MSKELNSRIEELNTTLKRYESAFECMKEDNATLRERLIKLEWENGELRGLLQVVFWSANNTANSIKNALGIKG